MATILLSAAGAAIGQGIGGTVLGLSGAVIGRAVGATLGQVIDQRLLGGGAKAVETGRIDRLRVQTAGEGAPIARIWGQMRVPGHVIWAAPLEEERNTRKVRGGGKGGGSKASVTEISYRLSVAIALCEGPVLGIGRVWADGEEIAPADLNMSVYKGDDTQLPDPVIAAHEGEDAPAYRGIAYVVLERIDLSRWGNRMPQLSFEVTRAARSGDGMAHSVQAVAMIPGTGEYTLATRPVGIPGDLGETRMINANTPVARTDFLASLGQLRAELPQVGSVSLVVSWFGDDLRVGQCKLRPKVEDNTINAQPMEWRAGGISRAQAQEVARIDDRPVYGGTPADESVIEAIRALRDEGIRPVFYPFILMEQQPGNNLPNPYTGEPGQPVMPWRGRITTALAPGVEGSSDGKAAAATEVAAFFGTAQPGDFTRQGDKISYHGPDEWSYRRFILHYAHLCAAAGGVDAFLIGSEMVALTQIRGAGGSYPAVAELVALAADVRAILGEEVKLSYAADWSEYFGHQPGGGDLRFHLDPLWADANIDFIGIDNYMPLSDWRDGEDHLDAANWRQIHDPAYLMANIEGGEGYDWYYANDAHRDAQIRSPIEDGAHGEAWVWRYKDLRNWWGEAHHERINGQRMEEATAWVPRSKPIWFTEIGCAALDRGTNQPNKFLDAYSSESMLPFYSNGGRDDAMQQAYLTALTRYWADPAHNPVGEYGGPMLDMERAHVWAWDARPWPAFPSRTDLWSDGPAWLRGHWLNGRASAVPLADLVQEICDEAGVLAVDVSGLVGQVRGFALAGNSTPRAALQQLMLAYGFDAAAHGDALRFRMRAGRVDHVITDAMLAEAEGLAAPEFLRAAEAEVTGRLSLTHIAAGGSHDIATAEARLPDDADEGPASNSELSLALTRTEGRAIVQRWLVEARVARDGLRLALPPSRGQVAPADVVALGDGSRWRVDRVEHAGPITVEATRIEPGLYDSRLDDSDLPAIHAYNPPIPVSFAFLDLPLLLGDEVPHAPHLAATATPWPGSVALWMGESEDGGYAPLMVLREPALMGVTLSALPAARPGLLDRGPALRIRMKGAELGPISMQALLAGGNAIAIGDGTPGRWEVMQFGRAEPLGDGEWLLSERLRGQAGSDAEMPLIWPEGSLVVVLDGAVEQLPLAPSTRGVEHHYRLGPAMQAVDDPSYRHQVAAFAGLGLRPLSPCHLRVAGRRISWIRRTRIGGDGWDGPDVPLGEENESYLLRLMRDGRVLNSTVTDTPYWEAPAALWADIAAGGDFVVDVAQVSASFGPGASARRIINV